MHTEGKWVHQKHSSSQTVDFSVCEGEFFYLMLQLFRNKQHQIQPLSNPQIPLLSMKEWVNYWSTVVVVLEYVAILLFVPSSAANRFHSRTQKGNYDIYFHFQRGSETTIVTKKGWFCLGFQMNWNDLVFFILENLYLYLSLNVTSVLENTTLESEHFRLVVHMTRLFSNPVDVNFS